MKNKVRLTKKKFARRHIGERFETPLTHEKLVDYDELFKMIGGVACQCAVERSHTGENVHHIYWMRRDYTTPLATAFRELPENKARLAKCNHHYLHSLTRPVPIPDVETMKAYVDPFVARVGELLLDKNIAPHTSYEARFWDSFVPNYLSLTEKEQISGLYEEDLSRSLFNGRYGGYSKVESRVESLLHQTEDTPGEPVSMQLLRGYARLDLVPESIAA